MVSDFIFSFEKYFLALFIVHTFLSILVAFLLLQYTSKRFVSDTKEAKEIDIYRMQISVTQSSLFQKALKLSLHKNNPKTNAIFFFLFSFTIPVLGPFLSLWIAWYLNHVEYEKRVSNTNILNLDEFGMAFLKVERIFGEGSMADLMVSEYAPKSKKLKALSSLAANLSPANLKIVRQTLFSTDDEIRMFGYAVINKAEQALSAKINDQIEIFQEEEEKGEDKDIERYAASARELGVLYWEMVYTELAHESLKENFLKEVKQYTQIAKIFYQERADLYFKSLEELKRTYQKAFNEEKPDEKELAILSKKLEEEKKNYDLYLHTSVGLYVMMGKVYMNEKDYDKAAEEFAIAKEFENTSSSLVLPYLAEVHYLRGNYTLVSNIMNSAKMWEFSATLYPIVRQWKVS